MVVHRLHVPVRSPRAHPVGLPHRPQNLWWGPSAAPQWVQNAWLFPGAGVATARDSPAEPFPPASAARWPGTDLDGPPPYPAPRPSATDTAPSPATPLGTFGRSRSPVPVRDGSPGVAA